MNRRHLAALAVPALLILALTACGSQVDPSTIAALNGGGSGGGSTVVEAGGTTTGGTTTTTTTDGGTSTGDTGGTSGSGDSGTGGSLPGTVPDTGGGTSGGTLPDGGGVSDGGSTGGGPTGGGGTGGGPTGGGSTGPGSAPSGGATSQPSSGSSGGAAPSGNPSAAPSSGVVGDCAGLQDTTGITDSTITIGNTADDSGPAPGVFEGSQDAVKAYLAYFASTGGNICGRKLVLQDYDSKTDGGAEQADYVAGCHDVFAMIGSMSSFDNAGAAAAQSCGLPDIRTTAITVDRLNCSTCFGALSNNPSEFQNAVPDFVLKQFGDAGKHAGMFYLNVGAAPDAAHNQVNIFQKRGMHFDVVQGIDISEFNYSTYAQQIKDKHLGYVQMIGSYATDIRLAQAMRDSGYYPTVFFDDPTVYTQGYVDGGGSAVDGTVTFLSITPFEDAASNPELQTYEAWLQQIKPGATPDFFGVYGWSAAKLFVQEALALGGKLSRASLIAATEKVDNWTANGLHAPQHVGAKVTGACNRFVQLKDGHWVSIGGTAYLCTGVTHV